MSSNIPTRRATRATRLRDENAVKGRPLATRGTTKPGTTAAAGSSKTTTAGVALDANTQNKRKREALGEVTNNKNKNVSKTIPKDGKLAKPHVLINTKAVRPTTKAPVRKTRASAAAAAKAAEIPEEEQAQEQDEDAMVVDEPAPAHTLHRVSRRLSTRIAITATTAAVAPARTSRVSQLKKTTTITTTRRAHAVNVDVEEPEEDDDDAHRASKRRRTSSEAGDEAVVEAEVEPEVPAVDDDNGLEVAHGDVEYAPEIEEEEEEVTGWEDLDKDDHDDPSMVSEYVVDIFKYLSECEGQTLPNPSYIRHQGELRWSQRGVLMDYLIGIHHRFRLNPETLYLAVNLVDRFLSMRVVSLIKLQLVGISCLFIASKFEEIVAPSVQHYLTASGMQEEFSEEDMLNAEKYILKTLNWSVSLFPQPMNWLRRISKADDYDPQVRTLAKFFLEIHVVERRLLGVKPSLLAAASIWLGRLVMNETEWTPNLAHYSGYSEKKILPVASIMINYCLRPEKHDNFIQKYASRKFSKVSVYIDDWVTARWSLGDKVNLADELAYLQALAAERKSQGLP